VLLTGTHPRTLDEKHRLALPRRIRDQLGPVARLFVLQGQDKCLWFYRPDDLERLAEKIDQAPAPDAEVRAFRRLFFANAEEVEVDRHGRILLPERLVQFAALQHDVVLIGVRDRLELWDARRWQEYLGRNASRFDQVAEGALQKSPSQRS
jgi:transcriptional regulator MraZ